MSKWKYTNNDGKHIINNERGVLIAIVCDEDVAIRIVAEHQENERLRKELEEATNLIGQQAMEMIRLQNLANKQAKEVDALKHSAVIVLNSHKCMEEELIKAEKELEEERKKTEFHSNAAKIYQKATSDIHNTLRWGDAENALERVETIIDLALGQEGEGNQ